jgi:hypothetical protein
MILISVQRHFCANIKVLKVGFLERDFERDHLAEKKQPDKKGQKNTLCRVYRADHKVVALGANKKLFLI